MGLIIPSRSRGRIRLYSRADLERVRQVQDHGGRIIVSPHFDASVVCATVALGLLSLPGVMTPSEAFGALDAGATALKLFPAESIPPAAVKAMRAVLPAHVQLLVSDDGCGLFERIHQAFALDDPTLILIAIAAGWCLTFVGAPLLVWTAAIGALLVGLQATGVIGTTAFIVAGSVYAVLALLLNLRPLRRAVLTRPIFAAFKKVLPEMSSTEREALEAGDTWWEAEMFRGRPDWNKLLAFKYTQLTPEEQSFLDNECEELCKLCDDWKIEFEDKDLPEEVWAYIREKKFLAMLIKKEYGGLGFSANAQSAVVTKLATKSIAMAVTVMVPNSLGPGELLLASGPIEGIGKGLLGELHHGVDVVALELLQQAADIARGALELRQLAVKVARVVAPIFGAIVRAVEEQLAGNHRAAGVRVDPGAALLVARLRADLQRGHEARTQELVAEHAGEAVRAALAHRVDREAARAVEVDGVLVGGVIRHGADIPIAGGCPASVPTQLPSGIDHRGRARRRRGLVVSRGAAPAAPRLHLHRFADSPGQGADGRPLRAARQSAPASS